MTHQYITRQHTHPAQTAIERSPGNGRLQHSAVVSSPFQTGAALQAVAESSQYSTASQEVQPDFSQVAVHLASPLAVQPKLVIGAIGDRYEQEADQVASQVVSQINASASQPTGQPVQADPTLEDGDRLRLKSIHPIQLSESASAPYSPPYLTPSLETSIRGMSPSGCPLADQVREPMEQAFGVDFSHVRVHTDSQSDSLNRSLQAHAFTTGQNIFFRQGGYNPRSQSGQTLLAHELTHVVQQLKGAQTSDTLPIQRYSEVKISGKDYRAADDRSMYVQQDNIYGSHRLWVKPGKGVSASKLLAANHSALKLVEKKRMEFIGDDGISRTMALISPQNVYNITAGTSSKTGMELWADCGKSARDIIGAGLGTGGGQPKAAYKLPNWKKAETAGSADPNQLKEDVMLAYVIYKEKKIGRELINKTLLAHVAGDDRTTLIFDYYSKLSDAERDKIDQEVGMNRWADPNVGEGFTISTGGAAKPGKSNWNFHWAGVIMKSNKGTDYVTLENYAVGDPTVENRTWDYQMYGSAKAVTKDPAKLGQTFHEQHRDVHGQHGETPTTLKVKR